MNGLIDILEARPVFVAIPKTEQPDFRAQHLASRGNRAQWRGSGSPARAAFARAGVTGMRNLGAGTAETSSNLEPCRTRMSPEPI